MRVPFLLGHPVDLSNLRKKYANVHEHRVNINFYEFLVKKSINFRFADDYFDQENNELFCKIHITVIQYQCYNFCVVLFQKCWMSPGSCTLCLTEFNSVSF